MRVIGFILAVFGALALGFQGFTYVTKEKVNAGGVAVVREQTHTIWVPPVVAGIAVVSGLLLLVSETRRTEGECRSPVAGDVEAL